MFLACSEANIQPTHSDQIIQPLPHLIVFS